MAPLRSSHSAVGPCSPRRRRARRGSRRSAWATFRSAARACRQEDHRQSAARQRGRRARAETRSQTWPRARAARRRRRPCGEPACRAKGAPARARRLWFSLRPLPLAERLGDGVVRRAVVAERRPIVGGAARLDLRVPFAKRPAAQNAKAIYMVALVLRDRRAFGRGARRRGVLALPKPRLVAPCELHDAPPLSSRSATRPIRSSFVNSSSTTASTVALPSFWVPITCSWMRSAALEIPIPSLPSRRRRVDCETQSRRRAQSLSASNAAGAASHAVM